MSLLRSGTVTSLRGLTLLMMTDTALVGTSTVTDDSGGGGTITWTYATAIPCSIESLSGSEGLAADRVSDQSTHLFTFPPETSVTVAARIQANGLTYEVTAVRAMTGEQVRLVEAVLL